MRVIPKTGSNFREKQTHCTPPDGVLYILPARTICQMGGTQDSTALLILVDILVELTNIISDRSHTFGDNFSLIPCPSMSGHFVHIFIPSFARTPAILCFSLFFFSSFSAFSFSSPPSPLGCPKCTEKLKKTYLTESSSPLLSGSGGPRLKLGLNFKQWTTPWKSRNVGFIE